MAPGTEVDTNLVGMFYRLRRVMRLARDGGFRYDPPSGGAMVPRPDRRRSR